LVVFLDTSAIYALANREDPNHDPAARRFAAALEAKEEFLSHNYVILEAAVLFHHRRGWDAARAFLTSPQPLLVRWVDGPLHHAAVERFLQRRGRFSLVDEVSFLVMREAGVRYAFAFDEDFTREGFLQYSPR
jgi:predicted nucleic acid-binding protein